MFSLYFLLAGCVIFASLGIIVLVSVPFFRLTLVNLLVFVVVAVPGAFVSLFVLGNLFMRNQPIDGPWYGDAVFFAGGGITFGSLAVWLKMHITNATRIRSPR
jgi:hypothetical protein